MMDRLACADGGKEDRPKSEVRFSNQNHLFGFKTLRGFGAFPVQPTVVFTDRGTLNLFDDSTYTVARTGGTSTKQDYELDADGKLAMYLLGAGNEPSTVFYGGYGRVGADDLLEPGDRFTLVEGRDQLQHTTRGRGQVRLARDGELLLEAGAHVADRLDTVGHDRISHALAGSGP